MRTTLTLDDDVALQIARLQQERGLKWKPLVNQAIRLGLLQMQQKPASPVRPPTLPQSLGGCLIGEITSVSEALAVGEGENFR